MNYNYYRMLQKKEFKRNMTFVLLVLLFATVSTYLIYNKFKDVRDSKMRLPNISVTFHDGEKIVIDKYAPIRDSVGLSTKAYKITIKNNTNKKAKYSIVLKDDRKKLKEFKDSTFLPRSALKYSIHEEGKEAKIYNLDDADEKILTETLDPKAEANVKIRIWATKSDIESGSYYYIGKLSVIGG